MAARSEALLSTGSLVSMMDPQRSVLCDPELSVFRRRDTLTAGAAERRFSLDRSVWKSSSKFSTRPIKSSGREIFTSSFIVCGQTW